MAHVLLIDDERSIRSAVGRYLRKHGHEVYEARDGVEALRSTEGQQLDLVITDINMPEMDGIEVILALAERYPGVPVIAVSGGGRVPKESLLSDARMLGAVFTLAKPFGLVELDNAVAQALGG